MPFPSLLRRQEARPEAQLQLFEHFGESQHAQTTEAIARSQAQAPAWGEKKAQESGPSEFQTAYVPCVRLRCANRTYGGLYLHRYARRETA